MDLAPIAFYAYRRPDHALKALTSLSQCALAKESKLYIFCDAAKHPEHQESVQQVRELVSTQQWCGEVVITHRQENMGLCKSILSGTTSLCEKYGRVIVLEDDLLLSPYFLSYMNEALNLYQDDERVMQISGHMFSVDLKTEDDAILLPFVTSWGWATWQRAWQNFDRQLSGYPQLKSSKELRHKFNLEGAYDYFDLLECQLSGKVDSWAVQWYLSVFMRQGLVLYPKRSLVRNIGQDGSGTHGHGAKRLVNNTFIQTSEDFQVHKYPQKIEESQAKFKVFEAISKANKQTLVSRLKKMVGLNRIGLKIK